MCIETILGALIMGGIGAGVSSGQAKAARKQAGQQGAAGLLQQQNQWAADQEYRNAELKLQQQQLLQNRQAMGLGGFGQTGDMLSGGVSATAPTSGMGSSAVSYGADTSMDIIPGAELLEGYNPNVYSWM